MPPKITIHLKPRYTAAETVEEAAAALTRGELPHRFVIEELVELARIAVDGRHVRSRVRRIETEREHAFLHMAVKFTGGSENAAAEAVAKVAGKSPHTVRDVVRTLDGKNPI